MNDDHRKDKPWIAEMFDASGALMSRGLLPSEWRARHFVGRQLHALDEVSIFPHPIHVLIADPAGDLREARVDLDREISEFVPTKPSSTGCGLGHDYDVLTATTLGGMPRPVAVVCRHCREHWQIKPKAREAGS